MRWPLPLNSYRRVSPERLVNCYAQQKPPDGHGVVSIVRAPGIRAMQNLGGTGRGLTVFGEYLWCVGSPGTELEFAL